MLQESAFLSFEKAQVTVLPRDYYGAFLSLILIHRKALETRFVVTGLAQWAGSRTGAGGRGGRGPGSIPGPTETVFGHFLGFSSEKWFSEMGRNKNTNLEKLRHNSISTQTDKLKLRSFILTRRGGAI